MKPKPEESNDNENIKVMVPCGEIGNVKEFKKHPCPRCGNTFFEFNGDGFNCIKCGYFPEIGL